MGEIVGFSRHHRRSPWVRRHRAKPKPARLPWRAWRTPWVPLLVLLGAAIFLYLHAERVTAIVSGERFAWCYSFEERDCVVDGDTIRYRGQSIRLSDIDAPELFTPRCRHEEDLARRATGRLTAWINEGAFEIVLTRVVTRISTGASSACWCARAARQAAF